MARRSSDIIVGLDIGTTKIAAIVAEIVESGLDVIGVGTHASRGLKKGVIVNIDSTVAAIKQAVLEAEGMSGCEISQVYVGIAGGHIKGVNSTGTVAIKDKEVRPSDVAKVLDTWCMCCRRNTGSMARTACASRSACAGCAWKRACTS
jgi:cell division protein FtsA